MKATMKLMVLALVGNASMAWAANGQEAETGLGTFIFLGFFALIVVFQAVPGLILFSAMLKGLFASVPVEAAAAGNHEENGR